MTICSNSVVTIYNHDNLHKINIKQLTTFLPYGNILISVQLLELHTIVAGKSILNQILQLIESGFSSTFDGLFHHEQENFVTKDFTANVPSLKACDAYEY